MLRKLDRLLLLLALLVALANLLPLGARFSWLFELTTHFRVQYLVATVALALLLVLRNRNRACLALLATGFVSAWPVSAYLPLSTPAATATATPIEVLTVNVSFRQFSARRLLEIVRDANPDLLLVQELTPYADGVLTPLDEQFPHRYKLPADGAYGIGLWSRLPLERVEPFSLARLPAIEARVRAPGGAFTMLGVHLSAPTSERRTELRNLALLELAARSRATSDPLIIAGDFNITPYSPLFGDFLATGGLTDSRRGRTLSVSWPTTLPILGIPIDHVTVNNGFTILAHRRLPDFESDHYGVLVELAPRAAAAAQSGAP